MQEPEIIYQNTNIIVANKPSGMPVHEAKHSSDYTLCDWLLERFPEIKDVGDARANENIPYRPGIVHRLDKQTSGVMVIARTQESFLKLKEVFKSRSVEKIYTALVCGHPKEREGTIKRLIGRRRAFPTKMAVAAELGESRYGRDKGHGDLRLVKEAMTDYRVVEELENTALLSVKPHTGRMHQIRVHLAFIGHPIAGDTVYGGANVCLAELSRLFLHATSLSFMYEDTRLKFEADLPEELGKVLSTLKQARGISPRHLR
ncbi:MAG: RNA pseudouridine synthase [Candidatus Sungbacteria bacterium]|nr:RNA pseudouridine synthase [Candidatus Sungbacteria bacterium]